MKKFIVVCVIPFCCGCNNETEDRERAILDQFDSNLVRAERQTIKDKEGDTGKIHLDLRTSPKKTDSLINSVVPDSSYKGNDF